MEEKPLGPFCSATDWTVPSCSKRIYMIPHRKMPSPGVTTGGAGDTVQTLLSPLRSCPTCLGLHGRTQRPLAVEPFFMFGHGQPHAHSSDSPQWITPCASAFSLEGEDAKRSSCPVSHLPAKWEAEGTKASKYLHWKSPVREGSCPITYTFLIPVTRSWFSFCWQSFSYGQRPNRRKDPV